MPTKTYVSNTMPSPVGRLTLVASDTGLAAVLWENDDPKRVPLAITGEDANHPVLREAARQLQEYFTGARTEFDLPLDFQGTDFQKRVWAALLAISLWPNPQLWRDRPGAWQSRRQPCGGRGQWP